MTTILLKKQELQTRTDRGVSAISPWIVTTIILDQ
jgi:hypothetical protein